MEAILKDNIDINQIKSEEENLRAILAETQIAELTKEINNLKLNQQQQNEQQLLCVGCGRAGHLLINCHHEIWQLQNRQSAQTLPNQFCSPPEILPAYNYAPRQQTFPCVPYNTRQQRTHPQNPQRHQNFNGRQNIRAPNPRQYTPPFPRQQFRQQSQSQGWRQNNNYQFDNSNYNKNQNANFRPEFQNNHFLG